MNIINSPRPQATDGDTYWDAGASTRVKNTNLLLVFTLKKNKKYQWDCTSTYNSLFVEYFNMYILKSINDGRGSLYSNHKFFPKKPGYSIRFCWDLLTLQIEASWEPSPCHEKLWTVSSWPSSTACDSHMTPQLVTWSMVNPLLTIFLSSVLHIPHLDSSTSRYSEYLATY